MTTNMQTLKDADWDTLERDVMLRIRLLRKVAEKLDGNALSDKIANELILPNLKLLAAFCASVEVEGD